MKKSIREILILSLALVLTTISANSQVVLNEFCTSNYNDWAPGGGGEFEDWVELYNPTGAAVDITGYWLSNNLSNPTKWAFPAGTSVPANGYLVVLFSGTGAYDPNYLGYRNTSFRVTQTDGDDIVFSNVGGTVLESYDLGMIGAFQANHSYARTADGGADWTAHTDPTPATANAGATYSGYATKPVLNIEAGYQAGPINVTITAEAGATIYYTTDGSEPTGTSTLYTGPVALSTTTSLRAISYSADPQKLPSLIETNTYFFGADLHDLMVVTISGGTLSDGSWGWGGGTGEFTHIEFFAPNGVFLTEATGDSNEHGNDSNAYDQRGFDYITRDALGYNNEVEYPVFHDSNRQGYERLIFKAAANDNYPSGAGAHIRDAYVHKLSLLGGLHLDERDTESCVLYINGDYWGVYEAREKVDDTDYTEEYFNQGDGFVDFLKTWGGTWEEYGSGTDWYDLVAFITGNDMTVAANYDYVLTQYNHLSLIDYFILNGYTVCTDWLNWNTAWWRGRNPSGDARRWRYALWDNDATFGHYVNYTGVPSTQPTADPCQIEGMGDVGGQGHVPVLNALFDNEDFFADYIQRYATLSNTIFSCERMHEVLDSMILVIEPEMTRQCQRWGGTVAGWEANVQQLRDFIDLRCASEIVGGIEDCYDVTAFNVTVQIEGLGEIIFQEVNLDQDNSPFSGVYFGDLPIDIEALSTGTGCGSFDHWEIVSGTGTLGSSTDLVTTLTITSDVTLVAYFSEPSVGPVTITTEMNYPEAGSISVNGIAHPENPYIFDQDGGLETSMSVTENDWYVFDHWESIHSAINPDDASTNITIQPCLSDTITAVFIAIDHFQLDIEISEIGGGIITMNGDTLDGDVSLDLLGGENYTFNALPEDEWSVFDHWEIDGNIVAPDNLSPSIILQLIESGSITAVFTVTPHYTITVMVDPLYSGSVEFEEEHISGTNYVTNSIMTVELEGNTPLRFTATPEAYYKFTKWEALHANPSPSQEKAEVNFIFNHSDTVVAHFEQEPFAMYIPNSFTPNDDGLNDVWRTEGEAIDPTSYHLLVFNRWGDVVFETKDMNDVWVGDVHSGEYFTPNDVYNYILKVKSVHENDVKEFRGTINVLR
ncbi:MAG: CotH kinase family protein [Flavobacteriales bacterium]|nr:CotH kinase family protein [Flavobacteriales bacterium]